MQGKNCIARSHTLVEDNDKMLGSPRWLVRIALLLPLSLWLVCIPVVGQSETATISGQIVDPSGLNISGARIALVDIDRGTSTVSSTNNSGVYTFPSVKPGRYRMEVTAVGFRVINVTGLTVNVQDHLEQNYKMVVGSVAESVTVDGQASLVNTESATVSTVVDRQFAENLPMNGRSFQTLIQLTPGVVVTATNLYDNGQFSVNGQRAAANYWMLDGVSANIGIGVNLAASGGNGLGGALGSFSVMGGTNSLVSVDALQEFRIQTSTFAPEFGRSPGAQISILTRSGTNRVHGTLFDYFRNDALDANDWFARRSNLPKPQERQNDFGGTFSGPIVGDRTFFFLSYEGLRLRLPQVQQANVPDLAARQNAIPAMQPYLNMFALPTPGATDDPVSGIARFRTSFSDKSSLDAGSVRIDHKWSDKLTLFGRYNYSPSEIIQRGASGTTINTVNTVNATTQTTTAGATWAASSGLSNDVRFNYSRTDASGSFAGDSFGGGTPLASLPFPNGITTRDGNFYFQVFPIGIYSVGKEGRNAQRQINIIDNLSLQRHAHSIKFGVDYRRLSPQVDLPAYRQVATFFDVPSAQTGSTFTTQLQSGLATTFLFRNLGVFAQDTWHIVPRLTVTYGLRWDVDFVPRPLEGPGFPAATGFDLSNPSNLGIAPLGAPPYETRYGNVAPRFGIAYALSEKERWQSVFRGGFGVFYDLASSEAGNQIAIGVYPFGSQGLSFFGSFPLADTTPAPIGSPSPSNPVGVHLSDPHLSLPYTLQWNVAIEQGLGHDQTLSASYIGAVGRRLLATAFVNVPTPAISFAFLSTNAGTSDYDALQVQFQRRLSHGLQALASYSWSHSIDTGSAGSAFIFSNDLVPSALAGSNRGPSDFDVRHALNAGVTYDIPAPKTGGLATALLGKWSLDNVVSARSATPIDVAYAPSITFAGGIQGDVRPDLVAGQPFYLFGAQCATTYQASGDLMPGQSCPGGRGLNPSAFAAPPIDPVTQLPLRQGNLGRNALRGFGAVQWDFAVHRQFKLGESAKLEFRGEMFNVLNHPNFGPLAGNFVPNFAFGPGFFGLSTAMLGRSLGGFGSAGSGAFSSLYQIGGPRSIQLALKLAF